MTKTMCKMKMKKTSMAIAAILICATMALTSCSGNYDNPVTPPEPEQLADATIIWYGTGGSNVDGCILENFRTFYRAEAGNYKHVNVVAQYKTSYNPSEYKDKTDAQLALEANQKLAGMTEEQIEEQTYTDYLLLCHPLKGATYRFALDPTKTLRQTLQETEPYGALNADFTCPDTLTNFINWAAAHYPAKKYIIMMADHGGGYMPNDETASARTRGLIYDDGYNHKCFSAKSFASAIRNADVRPEGIVLYLCLMNNLEFLYEVKDVTDYIVSSTYVMFADGGAFEAIVDNLAEGKDTRTALSNFVDANIKSWDDIFYDPQNPDKPGYYDLTLTETSRLNALAPVLREFTDRLVDTYQNGTPEQRAIIDECTAYTVKIFNNDPFYDMAKYMESLFKKLPEVFDRDFFNLVKETFNACIAHQRDAQYLTNHNYQVDYSVLLGVKGNYMKYVYKQEENKDPELDKAMVFYPDGTTETYQYKGSAEDSSDGSLDQYEFINSGTWPGTFASIYQQSTFDKLVGWSRWLLINESAPPAWSPSSFNFHLPDGDVSGNPNI